MMEREPVQPVEIDDYMEPGAEPGFYAIYIKLSRAPDEAWRQCLAEQWRRVPTGLKRAVRIVDDRLRVEIHGDDAVQEQLAFVEELVRRTNDVYKGMT